MHYHGPANAASPRNAKVAKLADAPDLGSGGATHGGSSPPFRTNNLESPLRTFLQGSHICGLLDLLLAARTVELAASHKLSYHLTKRRRSIHMLDSGYTKVNPTGIESVDHLRPRRSPPLRHPV